MKRSFLVIFIVISILAAQFLLLLNMGLIAMPVLSDVDGGSEKWSLSEAIGLEKAFTRSAEFIAGMSTEQHSEEVETKAIQIVYGLNTEYERLEAIYNWITNNIAYDLAKAENLAAYDSGAEYLLKNRQGVCHDYAELALAFLTAAGVEATYESGEVINSDGKVELHAWNRAYADGKWYALDTTWGAGFPSSDRSGFIQKPRPIYLTTPDELALLHQDPEHRKEQEHAYMLKSAASASIFYLPGYEEELLELFNSYRIGAGLSVLEREERLIDLARHGAADLTHAISAGEEYTLEELSAYLTENALQLGMRSASINSLMVFSYEVPTAADIYQKYTEEKAGPLAESQWHSVAISVVRRGDLFVSLFIYLQLQ